jgi:hypothetical protein
MSRKACPLVRDEDHGKFIRTFWNSPGFSDLWYRVLHQDGSVSDWRGLEGSDGRYVRVLSWFDGEVIWHKESQRHRDCFPGHRALPSYYRPDGDLDWYVNGRRLARFRRSDSAWFVWREDVFQSVSRDEFEERLLDLSRLAESL